MKVQASEQVAQAKHVHISMDIMKYLDSGTDDYARGFRC